MTADDAQEIREVHLFKNQMGPACSGDRPQGLARRCPLTDRRPHLVFLISTHLHKALCTDLEKNMHTVLKLPHIQYFKDIFPKPCGRSEVREATFQEGRDDSYVR